jgi:hypothetical protein
VYVVEVVLLLLVVVFFFDDAVVMDDDDFFMVRPVRKERGGCRIDRGGGGAPACTTAIAGVRDANVW